ncbi:MAG: ATP-dependent sacrificial sulfur transferase LarE [Peptostreptococcaceae bacterium]|nr:ATP-dependent sacrificial sulfur transferase LarE [Peptostreptococcaceae bacterium]
MKRVAKYQTVKLYTDGGSRGNPGDAAIGYVLYSEEEEPIFRYAEPVGKATNNAAEYTAMIRGLERAAEIGAEQVRLYMDSELIVKQIKREYKVKNEELRLLYDRATDMISKFNRFEIRHVRREYNKEADRLVNLALDKNEIFEEDLRRGLEERNRPLPAKESRPALEKKIEILHQRILEDGKAALAFSGGVDSSLLAAVCHQLLGDRFIAMTVRSSNMTKEEIESVKRFADSSQMAHQFVDIDIYRIENLTKNEEQRCYLCKKALFSEIIKRAKERGITRVYDGSNLDDRSDYRPGMRALKELSVVSPLMDAGFTKSDIREYSKRLGLETHDKEAMACLITRIPYHEEITEEKLRRIEAAEKIVRSFGYTQVRVRCFGDLAKIEIAAEEIRRFIDSKDYLSIRKELLRLGFSQVSLDLGGYVGGNMNPEEKGGAK